MNPPQLKTGTAGTAGDRQEMTRADLSLWLGRVSRTFALTIRMLGEPFRTYASAAYLLCRMIDTVEDCETATAETKCRCLREFRRRLVPDSGPDPAAVMEIFPDPATWDERLILYEPGVLSLIRSFPAPVRDVIIRYVAEMAEGMILFLEQQDEHGSLQFASYEMLDRYCYYVAGTVGLMMNGIFAALGGTAGTTAGKTAVELGIGLQLTNIVKDIRKDRLRNINYCPAGDNPHWTGPNAGPAWEVFSLASATIAHLSAGRQYIVGLESDRTRYKLFCIANYLMAWKTLGACLRDPRRTMQIGGTRISRLDVYATVLESGGGLSSRRYLEWRVDRLQRDCTALVATGPED